MAYHLSVRQGAFVSIFAALAALVGIAFTKEMLDEPKVWPYAEMQWTKDQVLPSVQSVLLWGNPKTGEHGMLRRSPPDSHHRLISIHQLSEWSWSPELSKCVTAVQTSSH